MDDQQEREVAYGLREGKPEAWQTLYDAYARRVWHSVARRMGPQSADVADVVQETFLAAARAAPTYDATRGSLGTWLCGIARKHVALYYRRRRRHERLRTAEGQVSVDGRRVVRWLEGRQEAPAEALAAGELADLVRAALGELPVQYETLLTAKYLDGATVEEIAGNERCSSTAVRSRLARARRAFRKVFRTAAGGSLHGEARAHDES
jgi:RNA polymerase sigma-70 factor (ECF subfamily)